jgi:ATP/maltotriose-dependent transcriptional regulator MalT
MDRLELEQDNLRAALGWSIRNKHIELGLRLAQAVWFFWEQHGHTFEAYAWFEKLLMLTSDAPARLRATALRLAGGFAIYFGDDERARMLLEEGLKLAREIGDKELIAWVLGELGFAIEPSSNLNRAVELLEEQLSLFRELHHAPGISHGLRGLSWVLTNQGNYERARLLLDEALVLAHHADDKIATAWATFLLGNLIWFQKNDSHLALALYQESLTLSHELRNEIIPKDVLFMMGQVARFQKDYDRAQAYYKESLDIMRARGGGNVFNAHILAGFASLICVRGFPEQAAHLFGATDVYLRHLTGHHYPFGKPVNFEQDVEAVCAHLGEAEFAAAFAKGQAMTLSQALNYALEVRTLSSAQAIDVDAKADQQPAFPSSIESLTERELEVLQLIAEGFTNHQIAAKLFLAVGTVKFYASQIYSKLQVQNRIQAMARARELNLLS